MSKHCFSPYCHQCPSASCKQLTLTLSQCFYEDCGYFSVLKDKKVCTLPCTFKLFLCVVLIFFISHLVVYICLGCVHIKKRRKKPTIKHQHKKKISFSTVAVLDFLVSAGPKDELISVAMLRVLLFRKVK